ncbi:cytochrome P450 [Streptomyces sp. NBC_01433]|uniref:cytochrome P450 n=1 Tax=Streptomyces sp. NBC_01433 TaxID=2903864 RepID=UPI00225AC8D1|nr:cytochrome P450 [Streptomyces sp. NBC_01433]MCX4679130.1 cytochrome P450 [Streptomyces sp. NBC_01433]
MAHVPTFADAAGGFPVLGHAVGLVRDPLRFFTSLPGQADLVRIRAGTWHGYVVCHPDLMSKVLLDDRTFDKGGPLFDKAQDFLGNGLITCPHRDHRRQRRLVQPAFRRDRLRGYGAAMSAHIHSVTESWEDGQTIVPSAEMYDVSIGIGADALFAVKMGTSAVTDLRRSIGILLAQGFRQIITPGSLVRMPTPGNRRYARANARLRGIVQGIIDDYRHQGVDHGDVLSILLRTGGEDEAGILTDDEIYDQVVSILVAGVETTAAATAWACLLLARHPDLQDRVHAEARTVLGGRAADRADLPGLKLTGRFITEVLRLYPPAWALTRTVTRDTDLAGHRVPAGASLIYSPYLLHHREDLFPSPDRFDPDRWLGDDAPQRPRTDYVPFGAGARKCVGNDFAWSESVLALATVADRWLLSDPAPTVPLRPVVRMTLTPPPAPLRVHRRPAPEPDAEDQPPE